MHIGVTLGSGVVVGIRLVCSGTLGNSVVIGGMERDVGGLDLYQRYGFVSHYVGICMFWLVI